MIHSTILRDATSLKEHAIAYCNRGWFVFPCWPGTKRPAIRWGERATNDVETARAWWTEEPRANIGIATQPSELVVFDVDRKNGLDGWRTLDHCLARFGELPAPVPMASSPNGGGHLYFRAPAGVPIKSGTSKLGDGLDIKAKGGCVTAPPSEVGGRRYVWDIFDAQPCELPSGWANALREKPRIVVPFQSSRRSSPDRVKAYCHAALESACRELAGTPRGQRNEALLRFGSSMGGLVPLGGITAQEIQQAARSAFAEWGERDPSKDSLTLLRGIKWGVEHPRELALV